MNPNTNSPDEYKHNIYLHVNLNSPNESKHNYHLHLNSRNEYTSSTLSACPSSVSTTVGPNHHFKKHKNFCARMKIITYQTQQLINLRNQNRIQIEEMKQDP